MQWFSFRGKGHKGYYRDAGLDVELRDARPGMDSAEEVLAGRANYGVGTSSLLLQHNAGKPIVVLAVIFQHSPFILLSRGKDPQKSIHSLAGKRLMLEPQSEELVAYLRKEGITLDKVKVIPHSFKLDDLISGNVDGVSGYVTNDPNVLDRAAIAFQAYSPRSSGIDFYGDNLFTTENELKINPSRARAFREASLKGWHYALQHPDEIIDLIITSYAPHADRQHLKYEAEQIRNLIQPNLVAIGYMHEGRWRHIADTYAELGMLPTNFTPGGFLYDPAPRHTMVWVYRTAAAVLTVILAFAAVRLILVTRRLKASEEKFFKSFENAPLMKAILSLPDGIFTDVNRRFLETTGFAKHEIIGRNSVETGVLIPGDRQKIMAAVSGCSSFGNVEVMAHTATGERLTCTVFGEVVNIGNRNYLLCIIEDVTEKRRDEARMRMLTQAVEQSPATIVITNNTGVIEYVNPKFTLLTGYSSEEAIGQNPRILKAGKSPPELYRTLWETISAGQVWSGELLNRSKSGEEFWEWATISPLRDNNGNIIHYIGIKEDITEKRILKEQLLQAQKMEVVGQLTSGIAHDFNNILCVIAGYGELLKLRIGTPQDIIEMVDTILGATDRAANLTRSLLAFSRSQVMQVENIDINHILYDFEKFIRRVIGEHINMQIVRSNEPLYVRADRGQIEQVLVNLAANARDAMPSGGHFSILASENANSTAVLTISDTGNGMDSTTLSRVFEPFFTTKETGRGTGLGLAMVANIISQHKGSIDVKSAPGIGTTFTITLPLVHQSCGKVPGKDSVDVSSGNETIFLVEDDETVLKLLEALLTSEGYRVISAANVREALKKFAAEHDSIQLVLLDAVMPEMSGGEVLEAIRSLAPDVRCLFCSGYSSDTLERMGGYPDGVPLIKKPFTRETLLKAVRDALDTV